MNWLNVKNFKGGEFHGFSVSAVIQNENIRSLEFFKDGKPCFALFSEWQSLTLSEPAPPKMKKAYKLTADLRVTKLEEVFNDSHSAKLRELKIKGDLGSDIQVEISEIEVEE